MSFGLLNSAMLLGLAGLALPMLVHLLSRHNYDVVPWGAMQFLELSRKTRRRIRLEEFLLMLLRMGMIGLVVLALSRPWFMGGLLSQFTARQSRDVVFVIDGSYSMGWEGKAITPHAAAIQWAHHFVDGMRPGDTVALLDARDRVRSIVDIPSHDFGLIRAALDALPPPAGSADLLEATTQGLRILSRGGNLSREVIVLTDGQARSWSVGDPQRWEVLDDLQGQSSIKPHVWVVDVMDHAAGDRTNFSLERLVPSRETTAVNLPVRVKTKLRYSGGGSAIQRKIYLEVDGQRLADATLQTPLLEPEGEFGIEFEHRFASVGTHLISAVIDPDNLSGDNRADAAITVTRPLPVLLVNGDPNLDPTRSETFFAQAALSATGNESPLVQARVVDPERFALPDPAGPRVILLANVPRLSPAIADSLAGFVAGGGGLLVAPGNKVDARGYNKLLYVSGSGLLPGTLDSIQQVKADDVLGLRILDGSLATPLVSPFRREHDGGLTDARFSRWWKITPAKPANPSAPPGTIPRPLKKNEMAIDGANELPTASPPVTAMRFDNSDPALVLRGYGRGHVALLAFPLDSDWSTFPAKPDFVPFLHELLFYLAGGAEPSRNVEIGEPLLLPVSAGFPFDAYVFRGPAGFEGRPERSGDAQHPLIAFHDTHSPGIYTLSSIQADDKAGAPLREPFVVNSDRAESNLTPLNEKAREFLTQDGRLKFIRSEDELQQQMSAEGLKSEFWRFLMVLLLAILVFELCMTRRLVRGGHAPP